MSWLTKFLGVSAESNDKLQEGAEEVKTVTEFLGDAAEKLPDILEKARNTQVLPELLITIIEDSAPWLSAVSDAVGDAVPPVKAILSIATFLTRETDPYALGLLAYSLAYQSALAASVKEIVFVAAADTQIVRPRNVRLNRGDLGGQEKPESFKGFRLDPALGHPLVRNADKALNVLMCALEYPERLRIKIVEGIHLRFAEEFRSIICNGKVKEKFDPLFRLLELGSRDVSTYAALQRHISYQIWRFENAPVLGSVGRSSMSSPIKDVFEPLDCGVLSWGEIRSESTKSGSNHRRRTPFDESFGGRSSLSKHIVELIGNEEFDDAIVVQGTAGAGKSVSMLYLCTVIRELALRPIRIRMRDLSLDRGISLLEDMAIAIAQSSGDEEYDAVLGPRPSSTDINLAPVLEETIQFGSVRISPYVFIFDGWDEISISASEGFRIRIEGTLDAIRRKLLSNYSHRIRVILTGRPSDDVTEAKFLRNETPILTIRPFKRPQFEHFVENLVKHNIKPASNGNSFDSIAGRIDALKKQFYDDELNEFNKGQGILGLPLLALLAVWLVINDRKPPENLFIERSALYRRLVDLTTREGGNIERLGPTIAKVTGHELRDLLQRTAAAMTLRGTEHISYSELLLRLEAGGLDLAKSVVDRAVVESDMAKLMLSFFFNTGNNEQGCEFIHKSFREYLFAEAIIEALKRSVRSTAGFSLRAPYWKDFLDGDPLLTTIEELGLLLGPQWISKEVGRHLTWLIAWEIQRAVAVNNDQPASDETTSLDLTGWERIRDQLVMLWDWWAEGVHLRPQPYRPRGKSSVEFELPYAVRLIIQMAPPELARGALPEPVRVTTVDAHLGDALFRLNCAVHFEINKATGWVKDLSNGAETAVAAWTGAGLPSQDGYRYQTCIQKNGTSWRAFAPSTPDGINHFLEYFIARINSAGWYPEVRFPCGMDLSGIDLKGAEVRGQVFSNVKLDLARLEEAKMQVSAFEDCSFEAVFAKSVNLSSSRIHDSSLLNGEWSGANFDGSIIKDSGDLPDSGPDHFKSAIILS